MLIRAFALWGLLLGQAAVILLYLNPETTWMVSDNPDAWRVIAICVLVGGVSGYIAEWLWRLGSTD